MPLIKCKECGNDVSSQASFCPHCGYKESIDFSKLIPKIKKDFLNLISSIKPVLKNPAYQKIILIFFVLVVVYFCAFILYNYGYYNRYTGFHLYRRVHFDNGFGKLIISIILSFITIILVKIYNNRKNKS